MRKYLTLTILLTAVIAFVISCQKEASKPAEENFDAAFAKEWYYGKFKKSPEWASSNLKGKKLPDWKHPIVGKLGGYDVVEFPLVKPSKTFSIKADNSLSDPDKKRIADASLSRILFIKKGNEILVREIDYIPDWNYLKSNTFDISKASVVKAENNFTGKVKTGKWDGTLLSLGMFEKGKFIKKGKLVNVTANLTEAEECQTFQVCIWQMDCELIFAGDVLVGEVCGPWYNTGECWDETYCVETDPCVLYGIGCEEDPGGDEPEFDEEAEAEIIAQVFSIGSAPQTESISFTSPDEMSVPFQWVVVENIFNLWQVKSSDIAIGYNSPNTGAVLYNLQHNGSQISGQTWWNRIPRIPTGPAPPLVQLSWEETSNSKNIASDYKSGTVTVSGKLKNFGINFNSYTQSCTITVH